MRRSGAALSERFYARDTVRVARSLLGRVLESELDGVSTAGRIVEVEAYVGPDDPAAHGFGNRLSRRNAHLFGAPGTAYVYLIYGMHWCFNAVTEGEGYPAAVLVRALEPVAGLATMEQRRGITDVRKLCSGPARLCQALGITGRVSGTSLERGPVRILRRPAASRRPVLAAPRIGVSKAADWPLRFYERHSPWVSRR